MEPEIQTQETLTPSAGEDTSVATPSVDEPITSPDEPVTPEVTTPEVTAPEGEHQPERPAQRRIRDLVSENKKLVEENSRLNQAPVQSPQSPSLSSLLEGRDSIDPEELDQIGKQFAAQNGTAAASLEVNRLRFEMTQEKATNQFDSDQVALEAQYDALNPKKPDYNPVLEEAIAEEWKNQAIQVNPYNQNIKTINPNVRLTDVAARYMKAVNSVVEQTKANTQAVLSTQRDETAITPNSTVPDAEVPFEQLTTKEMEAKLRAQGYFRS